MLARASGLARGNWGEGKGSWSGGNRGGFLGFLGDLDFLGNNGGGNGCFGFGENGGGGDGGRGFLLGLRGWSRPEGRDRGGLGTDRGGQLTGAHFVTLLTFIIYYLFIYYYCLGIKREKEKKKEKEKAYHLTLLG